MYAVYNKVVVILEDINYIFDKNYALEKRASFLLDYLRIRTKAFLTRWFHFKKEHFLGFCVEVVDYDIFLAIFRQVFVRNVYYFRSPTASPTIIDCGGNIGMTVLYWKYLYPDALVKVFEPSQEVIPTLKKNITLNNLKNIELHEVAVSDHERGATMHKRGAAACGNTLSSSIKNASVNKGEASYVVPTVRLSLFLKEKVDLLKMDIEGAEGIVFKELSDAGALENVKECVMEYHYYPQELQNNLVDLLGVLKKNEFDTQVYFEEHDTHQQFALSKFNSYSVMLKALKLSK
jgi:FkbM family methyltransferase